VPSIADLEALADEQRRASPAAARATFTHIVERDPHGESGANALFDRAELEERELRDRAAAVDDYARYLADFPNGSFTEQARGRLCALDSTRCH
jgi:hypothetical protein